MATYKVPQDVEADDKLIGPFSFRQFIYLIIVAMAGGLAWGLAQLFIGLVIIPLPIILFFGALALPLRKDQPMEIYLAAIVSYYLKPRKRLWDPDGIDSLIEITTPKTVERQLTKNLTQEDAEQRFSYLANIVDSQGWAIRGAGVQAPGAMNTDVYLEAQSAEDVLDTTNSVAQSFDTMMKSSAEKVREEAVERMRQPIEPTPQPTSPPQNQFVLPQQPQATPSYNPYPNIQQAIIQPIGDPMHSYAPTPATHMVTPTPAPTPATQPVQTPSTQTSPPTSEKPISAGIMNLANNTDLSIETIAHEAHRIQQKEDDMSQEVVISLR